MPVTDVSRHVVFPTEVVAGRLARESFVGGREDGDERRRPNLETATMTEAELACRRVCVRHRGRG